MLKEADCTIEIENGEGFCDGMRTLMDLSIFGVQSFVENKNSLVETIENATRPYNEKVINFFDSFTGTKANDWGSEQAEPTESEITVETMTHELFGKKEEPVVEKKKHEMNIVGKVIKEQYDSKNRLDFNFLKMFEHVTLLELLGIDSDGDQLLSVMDDPNARMNEIIMRLKMVSEYENDFSFDDLIDNFGSVKIGELVAAATSIKNAPAHSKKHHHKR